MANTETSNVVEITEQPLSTDAARDLTRTVRKAVNAECHTAEFVTKKATLTERRACVKDFNQGIPTGATERAAFFASL